VTRVCERDTSRWTSKDVALQNCKELLQYRYCDLDIATLPCNIALRYCTAELFSVGWAGPSLAGPEEGRVSFLGDEAFAGDGELPHTVAAAAREQLPPGALARECGSRALMEDRAEIALRAKGRRRFTMTARRVLGRETKSLRWGGGGGMQSCRFRPGRTPPRGFGPAAGGCSGHRPTSRGPERRG
jgi:hypothetical protein